MISTGWTSLGTMITRVPSLAGAQSNRKVPSGGYSWEADAPARRPHAALFRPRRAVRMVPGPRYRGSSGAIVSADTPNMPSGAG